MSTFCGLLLSEVPPDRSLESMDIPGDPRGAVLRRDAAAAIGERPLRAALANGVLTQIWRGVVVRSAHALDLRTRAAAAVLLVGRHAVLSGATAVALHGCAAAGDVATVHVTVPYSRSVRSRPGLAVHQNRFAPGDVVSVDGLPVFALDLALADFLCEGTKSVAFASLDQALHRLPEEERDGFRQQVTGRLACRDDRRGVVQASMLAELATGKADSPPESELLLTVVEAGFPVPTAQHPVHTIDGRLLYVLDLAWVERRIALEYDGYAAHEERAAYDAERDERLARRGWIVIRVRAEDLRDPSRVFTELREAFAKRSR
ncbi:uncharacterized protein DUF559 [Prauserella shujinwangii]|uniref:Uncharacterized protein DUF559 n=2 Tax=Prauserella shujinwangii TaxID=1453103 RepID=A0A2T0LMN8_9PSEU|nr:uncharacterized protein DUF559 [Prauserella shujinwangii]